jgi:anti-anti-sigma factor
VIQPIAPVMELVVERDGERPTVRVRGDVDTSTAPRLRGELLALCDQTRQCLVVDLSETTFLDCRGVAALLAVQDALRSHGRSLVLRGAHGCVRKILRMVGDGLGDAPTTRGRTATHA